MSRIAAGRAMAIAAAVALVAPIVIAGASLASEVGTGEATRSTFGTSYGILDSTTDSRSILRDLPGGDVDDPGAPWGFPNDNTLGFTTTGAGMDAWWWDYQGPIDIDVNMGKLVKKKDIASEQDYILEMYFDLVGWFWVDGDGVYDPAPGVSPGYGGDDPCPQEPFKLVTVFVNGQEIRTLEGHRTTFCTPGGPEIGRTFEIIPVGNDLPNQVRVPKDVLREGTNTVRLRVEDFVTGPPNNPYHTESNDGFEIYVQAIAIELAAPPLVLSHGWSNEWDPGTGTVPWQPTFKSNIKAEFASHTGQNPWRWASVAGKDGILLNFYDKKQDFRKSARELRTNVQSFHSDLGFSGKGWMHGHSMGGLVSRYYLEVLGGNAKIEKFAQTGTPNLGSWEAHAYTYGYWMNYEAMDEDYTAKWHWTLPGWPVSCCLKVWHGWRDWWNPSIWAYQWYDGPGHGRDHLADFMIKPVGSNPPLAALNMFFPAGGVSYFTVRGDCSIFTSLSCAASGYHWRGDGAVSLDSATMNGAIMHRTIDAFHEDIPAQVHTARWMVRYWGGLDLDSGRPAAAAGAMDASPEFPRALEERELRDVPRTQAGAANLLILPADVVEGPYEHTIPVDASPRATFVVFAVPTEDPLAVSLVAPDGAEHTASAPGAGVEYVEAEGVFLRSYQFTVDAPSAGSWTLRIAPGDVPPAEGIPLYVSAFLPGSPVELAVSTAPRHTPGQDATLVATLTRAGLPLAGASVTATTPTVEGTPTQVTLAETSPGIYTATVPAGAADGTTSWRVRAEGAGFERVAFLDVVVARSTDLRLMGLAGSPAGAWGGDAVALSATIASEGERAVEGGVTVQFFDGDPASGGTLLGSVALDGTLPVGETRTVTLDATAPTHALTLFARVDSIDLELDLSDNEASAAMPFVATPRTTASAAGVPGAPGWWLGPATVTLGPFDGSAPQGPIRYRVDGGAEQVYAAPFVVADDGAHTLTFWSVDALGNVEPQRTLAVGVDLAAPTATLLNPAPGFVHVLDQRVANPLGWTAVAGLVDVQVRATDAGAGVARVSVYLDDDPRAFAIAPTGDVWHVQWDSTASSVGDHRLRWVAQDAAGRTTEGSLLVYVLVARGAQVEHDLNAMRDRLVPGGA